MDVTFKQLMEAANKRRKLAKKLKRQGWSHAEIGRQLGVSRQRAQQMVDG